MRGQASALATFTLMPTETIVHKLRVTAAEA
jgi:hypothetical protein